MKKEAIFDSRAGRLCLVTSERVPVTSTSLKASLRLNYRFQVTVNLSCWLPSPCWSMHYWYPAGPNLPTSVFFCKFLICNLTGNIHEKTFFKWQSSIRRFSPNLAIHQIWSTNFSIIISHDTFMCNQSQSSYY